MDKWKFLFLTSLNKIIKNSVKVMTFRLSWYVKKITCSKVYDLSSPTITCTIKMLWGTDRRQWIYALFTVRRTQFSSIYSNLENIFKHLKLNIIGQTDLLVGWICNRWTTITQSPSYLVFIKQKTKDFEIGICTQH